MEDENINDTARAEIEEGRFFALIGYISLLCLVPLLLKRKNSFAVFHGKQGLVLFILEIASCIIKLIPIVGEVIFILASVLCGILSLIGIVKVLMSEYWEIPVIYDIAQKSNSSFYKRNKVSVDMIRRLSMKKLAFLPFTQI